MPRFIHNVFVLGLIALTAAPAVVADSIPKAVYQKIEQQYMDAVVRVSYSIEITNQNAGESPCAL